MIQISFGSITPITIEYNNEPYIFNYNQVGFLEDNSRTLSIQQILSNKQKKTFVSIASVNNNFGFTSSAYWLKIDIQNKTSKEQNFFLTIAYPLLNDIRFYKTFDSVLIDSLVTGENFPHNTRDIKDRNYIFKLKLEPFISKTFYFRICNIGETTRIPISIINTAQKSDYGNNDTFRSSIYYGYILFALIFNILMLFEFKRKHYALLSVYIFSMSLFLFIIDGFAFLYIWPNYSSISNHSIIFFAMFSTICMTYFANIFLETTKKMKQISMFFYATGIIISSWNMLPYPFNSYSFFTANFFILLTIFFISIISFRKFYNDKTHYNFIFFLSFIFIMIAIVVYILRNFGILNLSYITNNSIKLGFAVQITLLTISNTSQFRELFKKSNKFLEEMIQKRTILISNQNEQLRTQNKKIALQYKELKQSMAYAKKLQNAILPNKYKFSSVFKDHLLFYVPRDIVSGDFYWISEKHTKTYVVTADCTGHGIPGGFLSMLGISFLNQIVSKNTIVSPHEILNKLGILFSETINNTEDSITRDSMDISVCLIDHKTNTLEYSGAYNPIYVIRKGELHELEVDKISLRKDFSTEHVLFTSKLFELQEFDRVFMFSDGFYDQFGGENNKRFSKRKFKSLICSSSSKSMVLQKQEIEETFKTWKGKNEQVDDILILGFEV